MSETQAEIDAAFIDAVEASLGSLVPKHLYDLARRGAAAGELLEALKTINTTIEQDNIDNRDWAESVAKTHAIVRAAIAQFEATAATQETRNG